MPTALRTTATIPEAITVVAICFGPFIASSLQSAAAGFPVYSGTFSDHSFLWLVFTEVVLAGLALLFLSWRGYSVLSLVPVPTLSGSAWGVALFFAAWVAATVLVAPFESGQSPQPIDRMAREATATLRFVVPMALVNGKRSIDHALASRAGC